MTGRSSPNSPASPKALSRNSGLQSRTRPSSKPRASPPSSRAPVLLLHLPRLPLEARSARQLTPTPTSTSIPRPPLPTPLTARLPRARLRRLLLRSAARRSRPRRSRRRTTLRMVAMALVSLSTARTCWIGWRVLTASQTKSSDASPRFHAKFLPAGVMIVDSALFGCILTSSPPLSQMTSRFIAIISSVGMVNVHTIFVHEIGILRADAYFTWVPIVVLCIASMA
jgi:hypothetical protein